MHERAYSLLSIKSVDTEQRIIVGLASTPDTDRQGDRMDPQGAKFSLPMPLRWEHEITVGEVKSADVTPEGIRITAQLAKIAEPGVLRDRVEFAWQSVRYGLAKGLSIGWKPIKAAKNAAGGLSVSLWDWAETSIVSIPANAHATIQLVKSLDGRSAAALGTAGDPSRRSSPGASGSFTAKPMNTQERITDLRGKITAASERMKSLMAVREDDGLDWTAEQETEYDGLAKSAAKLTADLSRYESLELALGSQASPVRQPSVSLKSGALEFRHISNPKLPELPKGLMMGRYALALFAAEGDRVKAAQIAEKHWGQSSPQVVLALKAATELGVTTTDAWGGELTPLQQISSEFVELLRNATIVGRIPRLRRVPFRIKFPTQTGGMKARWVGEGGLKPVGKLSLEHGSLEQTKVAGIIPFSEEMARFSNPGVEQLVRDDLIAGCAETIDETFIDPSIGEIADIRPAAITNGAPNDSASGTDADALREDLRAALVSFAEEKIPVNGLIWVMTPDLAATLSLAVNTFSQPIFPGMTPDGGNLLGYQALVSGSVPDATLVLLKPEEIFLADDGGVNIDISRQATLVMDDGASPSVTTTMNLWQSNAVAVKGERFINWKRRRNNAVYYITNAVYHA